MKTQKGRTTVLTIEILTGSGIEMQKATGFLMDRNDMGPAFVEWETAKSKVLARPETEEDTAKFIRELQATGLRWRVAAERVAP